MTPIKISAGEIGKLPAGSRVIVNDVEWIRMADSGDTEGLNDGLFNAKNGDWIRWMALCYAEDIVTLTQIGETE
jgi:hypothetical protein